MLIEITQDSLQDKLKGLQEKSFLLVFGAQWCPDCVRINPYLDTLAQEFSAIDIIKVIIDKVGNIDSSYNIRKIPTLIFFKNGKEVGERLIEPKSIDPIKEALSKNF